MAAFKNSDKSKWILKCFEMLTFSIKKFKVCLNKSKSGILSFTQGALQCSLLTWSAGLAASPKVGFCHLLRTACDVHCFYSLINFNNMVHIYMYTRYFNITGTDGAVDFLVQTMFHILSADRVNFWVEDNIRREECIVLIKTVDPCMCNSVAELLTRGAGVLVRFLVQPCFKCIYMLIHPLLLQKFTKVRVKSSAGW